MQFIQLNYSFSH